MSFEHTETIGAVLLGAVTLMSAYHLTLRIREQLAEKPDPKLTYATRAELERLRTQFDDARRDERAEHKSLEQRMSNGLNAAQELIRKNAEHIAVLIAQVEMFSARLSELTHRTERMQERLSERV